MLTAVEWLRNELGESVRPVREVKVLAQMAGIGESALRTARAVLSVECFRYALGGPFHMCVPGVDHSDSCKGNGLPGVRIGSVEESDRRRASLLMAEWHASRNGVGSPAPVLLEQVAWVAERLLLPMGQIAVEDIPCGSALSLLLWAKSNEAAFRSMYDSKRMERVATRSHPAKKNAGRGVRTGGDSAMRESMGRSIEQVKKAEDGKLQPETAVGGHDG